MNSLAPTITHSLASHFYNSKTTAKAKHLFFCSVFMLLLFVCCCCFLFLYELIQSIMLWYRA